MPSTAKLVRELPRRFEYFPVLGKDFGHPQPTWSAVANSAQGQACYRAELQRKAGIHQCRRALTFRVLCCAQRKMNIGSSAYLMLFLGTLEKKARMAKKLFNSYERGNEEIWCENDFGLWFVFCNICFKTNIHVFQLNSTWKTAKTTSSTTAWPTTHMMNYI